MAAGVGIEFKEGLVCCCRMKGRAAVAPEVLAMMLSKEWNCRLRRIWLEVVIMRCSCSYLL